MDQEAFENMHRRYRKAMRTGDHRDALAAVRELAAADDSQDWSDEVGAAEERVWRGMAEEFWARVDSIPETEAIVLAEAVLNGDWSRKPCGDSIARLRTWHDDYHARRREREGTADAQALDACMNGEWEVARAEGLVAHLNALRGEGWEAPDRIEALIRAADARATAERLAQAKAKAYEEAVKRLRVAIESRDTDRIACARQATEFIESPMPATLKAAADRVCEEEFRRRRRIRVAAIVIVVLIAVGAASGTCLYYCRQHQLAVAEREEREARRLARIEVAHEKFEKALAAVKLYGATTDPWSVLRANDIRQKFEEAQAALDGYLDTAGIKESENDAKALDTCRLQAISRVTHYLKDRSEEGWPSGEVGRIKREIAFGRALAKTVSGKEARSTSEQALAEYGASFERALDSIQEDMSRRGNREWVALQGETATYVEKAASEIPSDRHANASAILMAKIGQWKSVYGEFFPVDKTLTVEETLTRSMAQSDRLARQIDQVRAEKLPNELLTKRRALVHDFEQKVPKVKELGEETIGLSTLREFLSFDTDADTKSARGRRAYGSRLKVTAYDDVSTWVANPSVNAVLAKLNAFEGKYAGKIDFDLARDLTQREERRVLTTEKVDVRAPLYMLLNVNDSPVLVRAAEYKDGTWVVLSEAQWTNRWNQMLFQVFVDGRAVDVEGMLNAALRDVPDDLREKVVGDLPYVSYKAE